MSISDFFRKIFPRTRERSPSKDQGEDRSSLADIARILKEEDRQSDAKPATPRHKTAEP